MRKSSAFAFAVLLQAALFGCTVAESNNQNGTCGGIGCPVGQYCGSDGLCHSAESDAGTGSTLGPASSSKSFLSLATDRALAGEGGATVTVTVVDDALEPLPGQLVTVSATGADAFVGQTPSLTGADGTATAQVSSAQAGVVQISAQVQPPSGSAFSLGPASITFVAAPVSADGGAVAAGPPSMTNSFLSLSSPGATADGQSAVQVSVTVLDDAFVPVAGQLVSVTATGAGAFVGGSPALTGDDGVARAQISSTQVGAVDVSAQVGSGSSAFTLGPSTLQFAAGAAARLEILAGPSTVAAGAALGATRVQVEDGLGNVIANPVTVALALSGGSPTAHLAGPLLASTDAGVAEFDGLSIAQAGSGYTLIASIPGSAASPAATAAFDVTAGSASSQLSSLSLAYKGQETSVVADGTDSVALTVSVADGLGNPLVGAQVAIAASGTGNSLSPTSPLTTGASGTATTALSSTKAEIKQLTITVTPAGGSAIALPAASVRFVSGAAGSASASLTVPSIATTADGQTTAAIQLHLADSSGNPIAGQAFTASATGSGNLLIGASGQTDASGNTSISLASTVAETKYVSVAVSPANGSPFTLGPSAVSFAAGPLAALSFLSQPTSLVAGVALPALQIATLDAQGNRVTGATTIALSISAGTGASGASLSGTSSQATSNGVATFAGLSIALAGSGYTLTAAPQPPASGVLSAVSSAFNVSVGPLSSTASSLTISYPSGSSAIANGVQVATLVVAARDHAGNPITGASISLTATGSSNTLSPAAAVSTDATGNATFTLASTVAESKPIAVSISSGGLAYPLATQSALFVAGAAARLAFLSGPVGQSQQGTTLASTRVAVVDAQGNLVSTSLSVHLALTAGSGTSGAVLAGTTTQTTSAGVATFSDLSVATAGTSYSLTASATSGGTALTAVSGPFSITVGPPGPPTSTLTLSYASGETSATANGVDAVRLLVQMVDGSGNAVSGAQVTFTASGSGNVLTPASGLVTDAFGIATASLSSTVAETKSVSVSLTPAGGSAQTLAPQSATFVAGPLSQLAFVTEPQSTTAGALFPAFKVAAKDAFGNAAPAGTQLALGITSGTGASGATLHGTATATTTAGSASFSGLSIAQAGLGYTLTASIVGSAGVTTSTDPFDISPGAISLETSTFSATYASGSSAPADGSTAVTLSLLAEDAEGNPVPGASVLLALGGSSNLLSPAGGLLTDETGAATAHLASTLAQSESVLATATPSGGVSATFTPLTIAFTAGPIAQLAFVTEPASATSGAQLATTKVAVLDAEGNAELSPLSVQLAITSGTGTSGAALAGTTTQTTSGGVATFRGLSIATAGFGYTLSASLSTPVSGVSSAVCDPFDIAAGPVSLTATSVALTYATTQVPATSAIANNTDLAKLVVTARDAANNPIAGLPVSFTISGSANFPNPTSGLTTGSDGTAEMDLSSSKAETKTIVPTLGSGSTAVTLHQQSALFVAGPLAQLAFSTSPSGSYQASQTLGSTVVATTDAFGNAVTGAYQIALALDPTSGSPGAILLGTLTRTTSSGSASFNDLSIATPGANYRLIASLSTPVSGVGSVTSSGFTIAQPVASGAASETTSSMMLTNANFSDGGVINHLANGTDAVLVSVTALDANSEPLQGQTVTVAASPSTGVTATTALTDALGNAQIRVTSTHAATVQLLAQISNGSQTVSIPSGLTRPSATFTADPSTVSATLSTVTANPSGVIANGSTTSAVTVTVVDAYNNPLSGISTQLTPSATAIINSGSVGVGSFATATTSSSGVATFNVASNTVGSITFTAQARNSASVYVVLTQTVTVQFLGGVATSLVFSGQPTDIQPNGIMAPSVVVELLDSNQHLSSSSNISVTLSLGSNPQGATLGPPANLTQIAQAGLATFAGLTLDKIGRGYTLLATAPLSNGTQTANSAGFGVTAPQFNAPLTFTSNTYSISSPTTGSQATLSWTLGTANNLGAIDGLNLFGPAGTLVSQPAFAQSTGSQTVTPFNPVPTVPQPDALYQLEATSAAFSGWQPDVVSSPLPFTGSFFPLTTAAYNDGTGHILIGGAADSSVTIGSLNALSYLGGSGPDCVLARVNANLTASTAGSNNNWAIHFGGTNSSCSIGGVVTFPDGSALAAGSYSAPITIGSTTLPDPCSSGLSCQQIFLVSVSSTGAFNWATYAGQPMPTAGADYAQGTRLVAIPGSTDDALLTGSFTPPFNGGPSYELNFYSTATSGSPAQSLTIANNSSEEISSQTFAARVTAGASSATWDWAYMPVVSAPNVTLPGGGTGTAVTPLTVQSATASGDGSVAVLGTWSLSDQTQQTSGNLSVSLGMTSAIPFSGQAPTFAGATLTASLAIQSEGSFGFANGSGAVILRFDPTVSPTLVNWARSCGDSLSTCETLTGVNDGTYLVSGSSSDVNFAGSVPIAGAITGGGVYGPVAVHLASAGGALAASYLATPSAASYWSPTAVVALPDGSFALGGSWSSATAASIGLGALKEAIRPGRSNQSNLFLALFDNTFNLRWIDQADGNGSSLNTLAAHPDGNLIVIGEAYGNTTSTNMFGPDDWHPQTLTMAVDTTFAIRFGGGNYQSVEIR